MTSTITTSYTDDDGKEVEEDSPQAYRLVADELQAAFDTLNAQPVHGLMGDKQDEARAIHSNILSGLGHLQGYYSTLANRLDMYNGNREAATAESKHNLDEARKALRKRI